jgi:hypothetical protein
MIEALSIGARGCTSIERRHRAVDPMKHARFVLPVLLSAWILGLSPTALAQSTDGYHSIQVFPLVVDTASFTQRLVFDNATETDVVVHARFFPADGTAQAAIGPLDCNPTTVPATPLAGRVGTATVASLRTLCPGLPAGSAFGMLYTWESDPSSRPFAGFSRVSNPSGNGFTAEAFPAHTFGGAASVVTGLRRLAATDDSPAFQTNCFVGNLNVITPDPPITTGGTHVTKSTRVGYALYRADSDTPIGQGSIDLPQRKIVRLLDVFAAAGVPPGDYDDVSIRFTRSGFSKPAIVAYCTVQDNTSYGADFRIAKQVLGDNHVWRGSPTSVAGTSGQGTSWDSALWGHHFEIAAGPANANTHVVLFRHPDYIRCELRDPTTNAVLDPSYGLEMRLVGYAGGNDMTGFGEIFIADKGDTQSGSNEIYSIEVESRNDVVTTTLPYALHCQSGSGHPLWFPIVRYQEQVNRF